MVIGGLLPTTFGVQVESGIRATIIEIASPPSETITLSMGVQAAEGASYGTTAPEPQSATLGINGLLVFGGKATNGPNLQVELRYGCCAILLRYTSDSQGYYGYKAGGRETVQVKYDGLYVGSSRVFTGPFQEGSTIQFQTMIHVMGGTDVLSNSVTVTVQGNPPTGTVTIQGCDGKVFLNVGSSDTIQTCSPIYFEATITQGLSNVKELHVVWSKLTGEPASQQPFTRGTPPAGSKFQPDQNKWYGTLPLAVGKYAVTVSGTWNTGTEQRSFTILSIIGYFDVEPPTDYRFMWGLGVFMTGAAFAAISLVTMIPRRRP